MSVKLTGLLLLLASTSAFAARMTYTDRPTKKSITFRYSLGYSTSLFLVEPTSSYLSELEEQAEAAGSQAPEIETVKFQPNVQLIHTVGLSYKGIGFAYGHANEMPNSAKESFGETDAKTYGLRWHLDTISLGGYYHEISGLFQSDPNDSVEVDGNDIYPQYPDMRLLKSGADLIWKLSPGGLSLGGIFDQSEIQTKSGGTILFRATYNNIKLTNKSQPILQSQYQSYYPTEGNINSFELTELGVGAGGGYTLVIAKSFYISSVVNFSLSSQTGHAVIGEEEKDIQKLSISTLSAVFSIGVNKKKSFFGFTYFLDNLTTTMDEIAIVNGRNDAELYFGFRF